ncbi:unnamed protein product [Agarophyton chilense]
MVGDAPRRMHKSATSSLGSTSSDANKRSAAKPQSPGNNRSQRSISTESASLRASLPIPRHRLSLRRSPLPVIQPLRSPMSNQNNQPNRLPAGYFSGFRSAPLPQNASSAAPQIPVTNAAAAPYGMFPPRGWPP